MNPPQIAAFILKNECQYRNGEPARILCTDSPKRIGLRLLPIASMTTDGQIWSHHEDGSAFGCTGLDYHLVPAPPEQQFSAEGACGCRKCMTASGINFRHMVVCPTCGNKRCPHASYCSISCSNSNLPGQKGSIYEDKEASVENFREALQAMLHHSCVKDAHEEDKDADDFAAESRARRLIEMSYKPKAPPEREPREWNIFERPGYIPQARYVDADPGDHLHGWERIRVREVLSGREGSPSLKWPEEWLRNGFNGSIATVINALRFLATSPRPLMGQQSFNAEHLHQIADELAITRDKLLIPHLPALTTPAPAKALPEQARVVPDGIAYPPDGFEYFGEGPVINPSDCSSRDIILFTGRAWDNNGGQGWVGCDSTNPKALRIGTAIHAENFKPTTNHE